MTVFVNESFDAGVDFALHDNDVRGFQVFCVLLELGKVGNFNDFTAIAAGGAPFQGGVTGHGEVRGCCRCCSA